MYVFSIKVFIFCVCVMQVYMSISTVIGEGTATLQKPIILVFLFSTGHIFI